VDIYAQYDQLYTVVYAPGSQGTWTVGTAAPYYNADLADGSATPAAPSGTALTATAGYRLTGWSPAIASTVAAGDAVGSVITYTAQWGWIDDLQVRFLDWDGTVLLTQTVSYGASATPPSDPTRWGYAFTGWSPDYTNITADTDIYAQYGAAYSVYYKDIMGLAPVPYDPNQYGVGATVTVSFDMPASVGEYVFQGWTRSFGASAAEYTPGGVTTFAMPANDVTLYAVWAVQPYDVAYAPGGHGTWTLGTVAPYYYIGVSAWTATPAPPNAAALTADAGYRFTGWSPAWNATVNPADAVGGVITYTAQWGWIDDIVVNFLDWDGTILASVTVSYGDTATPPPNPTRTGYDFTGWSDDYTGVTGDMDIYAEYEMIYSEVKFLDWDGTVLYTQTVAYGGTATPPPDPARAGYEFTGWSPDYTNITADVVIYAQYEMAYAVAYAPGSKGTWTVGTSAPYYYEGLLDGTATPAAPNAAALASTAGYRFAGWSPVWNATVSASDATGGVITYTAQWALINDIVVNFLDWDGKLLDTQVLSYGDAAVAPVDPTRTGYTFTGWSDDFTSVTGDIDIVAQYGKNVSVTFWSAKRGNLLEGNWITYTDIPYGSDLSTAISVPTPEATVDCEFIGWAPALPTCITSDMYIEAKFEQTDSIHVYFVDWDGNSLGYEYMYTSGSAVTPPADPTRTGYTFTGWDQDLSSVTGSMVVTAQYVKD
jgi:uncharacterized repeat protein (TIGR02543 family)